MSVLKSKKKEKAPKNLLTFASKANKQINKQKNYAKIISTNKIFFIKIFIPQLLFLSCSFTLYYKGSPSRFGKRKKT